MSLCFNSIKSATVPSTIQIKFEKIVIWGVKQSLYCTYNDKRKAPSKTLQTDLGFTVIQFPLTIFTCFLLGLTVWQVRVEFVDFNQNVTLFSINISFLPISDQIHATQNQKKLFSRITVKSKMQFIIKYLSDSYVSNAKMHK